MNYAPIHIASIDVGVPIKVLCGLHAGCLELIATTGLRSFMDLKGKRVGMHDPDAPSHVLVALMASYIGLDPSTTSNGWSRKQTGRRLRPGKFDAYLFGLRKAYNYTPKGRDIPSSTRPSTPLVAALLLHDLGRLDS